MFGMQLIRVMVASLTVWTAISGPLAWALTPDEACEGIIKPLIMFDVHNPNGFKGLYPEGKRRLKAAQINLKETIHNFNMVYEGMANILAIDLNAMITKNNALHLGGPGAAKTGHLLWLFPNAWHIQMHEWRTDGDLFGLPRAADLEKGLIERNSKNSIVHAEVGIIDEATAATPAVFGSMLSFMNPNERFYMENGIRKVAKTRSAFLTGNSTRSQMMLALWERLVSTGPALLNRTIHKSWMPNWNTWPEQMRADPMQSKMNAIESALQIGNQEQREDAKALKHQYQSRPIDWQILQHFAIHAFVADESLVVATQALANRFRLKLAERVAQSHEDHRDDPKANPYIFVPSAEMTERLRRVFEVAIKTSVMIDYLDMVGWEQIANLKTPIVLKPMSMWRLSYILTTIGGGINIFDPSPNELRVRFNLSRGENNELIEPDIAALKSSLRDPVDRAEFQNMIDEQTWFNDIMREVFLILQDRAKLVAKELAELNDQDPVDATLQRSDLEVALYKFKKMRGY